MGASLLAVLGAALLTGKARFGQGWDFIKSSDLTDFTNTAISSGSAAMAASHGGKIRFTGAATTDNSGAQIQIPVANIDFSGNQHIEAVSAVTVNHADAMFMFGFAVVDTSMVASLPSDGIWLIKDDAAATISLEVRRGGVSVLSLLGSIVKTGAAQVWGLSIRTDGGTGQTGKIVVYLDGNMIHEGRYSNLPYDAALTLSFAAQSGSATSTQTVDLDLIDFSADR